MAKVAVIIPARNEAASLPGVMEDIRTHLPEADVIVVDDGSEDGTARAAESAGAWVLRSPISLGIGGAVQLGVRHALEQGYDLFVRMDGDGQHRAASLAAMLQSGGPGILVQGSRTDRTFAATSNHVRRLGSRYFRFLFRTFTPGQVADPTSGLMCFGRDLAEKFARFYPSDFPEIESLVLLLRSGHRVVSAPAVMESRRTGASSIDTLHGLVYMFSVTLAFFISFLRKNPYGAAYGN